MIAPLRVPRFRLIWGASVLSNLGLVIQGVGAAWTMTQITNDATLVALVQSATLVPMLLFTLPAGAMADVYPRRTVALAALAISLSGTSILSMLAFANAITPVALLILSFVAGCGMAFFWPAWQSSAADDVPADLLPAAVGLNSISYNAARVVGPGVGGMIVAGGSATVAFVVSFCLYLPMVGAQLRTSARRTLTRLPPERIGRALITGLRYAANATPVVNIVVRSFALGAIGGSVHALMPLIARDLLGAGAGTFGILLGLFGAGAVVGIVVAARLRQRFGTDGSASVCIIALGLSLTVVGVSRYVPLTGAALIVAGAAWMCMTQACSVGLQMSVPRWVAGRALACFQASLSGGIALAGVGWGLFAERFGVGNAFIGSGLLILLSIALRRVWPLPEIGGAYVVSGVGAPDPELVVRIDGNGGPILIEVEYSIPVRQALGFHRMMTTVQRLRKRNGAYGWSIARDLGRPDVWKERFHFPTWHDYLRQRERLTDQERELQSSVMSLHAGTEPVVVRRFLLGPSEVDLTSDADHANEWPQTVIQ
ncbi:protein of unknown function DUF894 DitE [Sphingobium chlorophenolicum L-1]|uniref:Major facilitator superfamily (MFS) profile domain-containing protein n=1 Tax=Sphingobium chlorophenolicum L-1 TaxID=690566 RepID=F6F336_SPHCR|nr:MFS transporter [Sphingobium chlorophenolicum]AEG50848.1 protein of unknown function DUF894 DitE [Sphingobium chlorophenolicum L-1]